jgi:hypothetical protein
VSETVSTSVRGELGDEVPITSERIRWLPRLLESAGVGRKSLYVRASGKEKVNE